MEASQKTLIIIPAYNEEMSVGKVIEEIKHHVAQVDILVVNDGSTDATGDISREKGVWVLDHPYNMGIGATMQTGFLFAFQNDYDLAIQVDGDGQHDSRYLEKLISPLIKKDANVVIGSRYLEEKGFKSSFLRRVGIRFFSILCFILSGERVTDPTSGFRAFDKKVIDFFSREYPSDYPEAESIILLHKKGFAFREIPVMMKERQGGVSSINLFKSVYYMVKVTLSMLIGRLKKG
jgi:glycosyltransferase involved in cell wall biosynthesis